MRTGHLIRRLNGELDRRSRGEKFGLPLSYFKMLATGLVAAVTPSVTLKVVGLMTGARVLVLPVELAALITLLVMLVAFAYYTTLFGYASLREAMETGRDVRRVAKENAERRRKRRQPRGVGIVTIAAALFLPPAIRADAIATVRDVLAREINDASPRRAVFAVVCRLLWSLIRNGLIERKQRLAGGLAGIAFALTVVPGIQSILGLHVGPVLGAVVALASIALGGFIGGWAADLGVRRTP